MNKTYADLKSITKPYQVDFMSDNISLLAEDKELFVSIFEFKENRNVYQIINHIGAS